MSDTMELAIGDEIILECEGAPAFRTIVLSPEVCISDNPDYEGEMHMTTVCTECIDSWLWDYELTFPIPE